MKEKINVFRINQQAANRIHEVFNKVPHPNQFIFYVVTLMLFIYACNPVKNADRKASRNEIKSIFPTQSFDSLAAKKMLAYGKATIKGVVYKKTNKLAIVNAKRYGYKVTVTLYPATPYFMEYYNLRQEKESKRTKVYISDEAYRYRIEVKTDEYGRFTFDKIKPGKYFLQAIMTTTNYYTQDVEVGSNSYGTRFYEKQRQYESKTHRLEKFVEIKNEKEEVEIVLK
ncbi:beta-sandwich domain-containing protein [Lacibacter sp.]|uniref:beta-sandwich domain-containing protein n=1 Tax=Lacibacter sp. TaxID=1915409 RepID=UPI002B4B6242|nr:DUF2012 domain-containing protein [Lacibacter sp.]HLP38960.1 DUF2012 domain-containing protein [Lacibacter sp.]